MSNEPSILGDQTFMDAVLDLLIPPSADGRMAGAGSLGLSAGIADAVEADERWAAPIAAGLRAVHDAALERDAGGFVALSPPARLELFESQLERHPTLIRSITTPLYLAYYQHPTTLAGLGEPPRPPFPGGFDVEATHPALLERLRSRARPQP